MKPLSSILVLIIILTCMSGFQCNKEEPVPKYNFEDKIDIFPAKKSYSINDTIWVSYENNDNVFYDKLTSKDYMIDSTSIPFRIFFTTVDEPFFGTDSLFTQFVVPANFSYYQSHNINDNVFETRIDCNTPNRILLGIVLKRKGIFLINPDGNKEVYKCPGNLNQDFFLSIIAYKINVADCNEELYSLRTKYYVPQDDKWMIDYIHQKKAYCVRVK